MPCRVGITQNLPERRNYWVGQHPGLHSWKAYGPYTRQKAQALETQLAKQQSCLAQPGGAYPNTPTDDWYVYYFEW